MKHYDFLSNEIFLTDSYKVSHWRQYPKSVSKVFSYFSSRGGFYDELPANLLLRYQLKRLEGAIITQEKIDEAYELFNLHFNDPSIFNKEGWQYILEEHGGKLPLKIRAVSEGTIVPKGQVLMVAENTDSKCPWITNYFETFLLQNWYPITVGAFSYSAKKIIHKYLSETGTPELLQWKFHDFGVRGVSSMESSAIGGAAHLMSFSGSDNIPAVSLLKKAYGVTFGDSIPAAEHSTASSWVKEKDFFQHMINEFSGMVAVVSDTYDIFEACKMWSTEFKDQILSRPEDAALVIRPDSGDPCEVLEKMFAILFENFGFETNSKGYKLLPPQLRVIQGDGIDLDSIKKILEMMKKRKISADNISFGCGGALLQKLNRDTNKFAFKASAVLDNGEWRDIQKKPITDPSKASFSGLLDLVCRDGKYITTTPSDDSVLTTAFENGRILWNEPLAVIRDRLKM